MTLAMFILLFILPLMDISSCSPLAAQHKTDQQLTAAEMEPLAALGGSVDPHGNPEEPDKRNWNNLSGMWGKRGWNNLSGAWGKRNNNWNNLSGMWGKRGWNNLQGGWGKKNNWNNLSGMWGKRGWNNLSGGWGKRANNNNNNNWNNLSGMWGKRSSWNNLSGMWGKRLMDEAAVAEENSKRTQWNNLKGMWGKRSDSDLTPDDLYGLPVADDYQDREDYHDFSERM